MVAKILGCEQFVSKKGNDCFIVHVGLERDGCVGLCPCSLYTNEAHYKRFVEDVGSVIQPAIFFKDKKIYYKGGTK